VKRETLRKKHERNRNRKPNRKRILVCAGALLGVFVCVFAVALFSRKTPSGARRFAPLVPKTRVAAQILKGAKAQIGADYDASYRVIAYPLGDVPKKLGACTDVIVRAFRSAGFDLQKLIHEDMKRDFSDYPQTWGLPAPDTNIDHRRVPNQIRFFQKHAQSLTTEVSSRTLNQWQPGDVVFWNTGRTLHTGIISDTRNDFGQPLVVHNGWTCIEGDHLTAWQIIGHFRYPTKQASTGQTG